MLPQNLYVEICTASLDCCKHGNNSDRGGWRDDIPEWHFRTRQLPHSSSQDYNEHLHILDSNLLLAGSFQWLWKLTRHVGDRKRDCCRNGRRLEALRSKR